MKVARFFGRQAPLTLAAACSILFAGMAPQAIAADPDNEIVQVPPIPVGTDTVPVNLSKIGTHLSTGQAIGNVQAGLFCVPRQTLTYSSANYQALKEHLLKVFYAEAASAGFKIPADRENLFAEDSPDSEYLIGAALEAESVDVCLEKTYRGLLVVRGRATYDLDWQIYSSIEKKIVSTSHTTGSFEIGRGSLQTLSEGALAINARKFLASQEFRSVFIGSPRPPGQLIQPSGFEPIVLSNRNDGPSTVADDVGAVVTVFTGAGLGSGFLVGAQGLLITNHHVVGDSKFVKIRWSDGYETVGEVLRSDARRDVALVKTDPRGRKPLRISLNVPSPGDDVYAIGTPLDQKYSSTVTKGVVSATRVFNGLSYIQADVAINHGNSGGPLLDKGGRAIGITIAFYGVNDIPVGVNLFIPLRDALEFLGVSVNSTSTDTASLH